MSDDVAHLENDLVERRLARIHANLQRAKAPTALRTALDAAGRSLDVLGKAVVDDELALRLASPRAVATSYVTATAHLAAAGVHAKRYEQVLEEGRERLVEELAKVQRTLAPSG